MATSLPHPPASPSQSSQSHPRPPSNSISAGRPPSLNQLTEAMRLNPDRWQQLKIETDAARLATGIATTTTNNNNNPSQSLPSSSIIRNSPANGLDPIRQLSSASVTPLNLSPASSSVIITPVSSRLRLPSSSLHRAEALARANSYSTASNSNSSCSVNSPSNLNSAINPGSYNLGSYRISSAVPNSNNQPDQQTSSQNSNFDSAHNPESALSRQQQHQLLVQRRASASDIGVEFNRARAPSLAAIREHYIARTKPEMTLVPSGDNSQSTTEKSLGSSSTTPLTDSSERSYRDSTGSAQSSGKPADDPIVLNSNRTSDSTPTQALVTVAPSSNDQSTQDTSDLKPSPQVTLTLAPQHNPSESKDSNIKPKLTNLTEEPERYQDSNSQAKPLGAAQPKLPPGLEHTKASDPNNASNSIKSDVHPLQHSWTLFFDSRATLASAKRSSASGPIGGQAYEAALQTIGTFNTVEDFCRFFNWTVRPSQMDMHSSVQLFKSGIKPMWEDPANSKGGKWTMTMKSNSNLALLDKLWTYLVLGLVGEQVDLYDDVCGAIVSTRPKGNRVQIWVREKGNVEKVNGLGKRLISLLEINEDMGVSVEFTPHSGGYQGNSKFISLQPHHATPTSNHARSATFNGASLNTPTRPSIGGMVMGSNLGRTPEENIMAANEMRRSTSADISSSASRPNLVMHHSHLNNQMGNLSNGSGPSGAFGRAGGPMKINQLNSNDAPIQIGVWRPSNGPPGIIGRGVNMASMVANGVSAGARRPQSHGATQPGTLMGTPAGATGRSPRTVGGNGNVSIGGIHKVSGTFNEGNATKLGQETYKMSINKNLDGANHQGHEQGFRVLDHSRNNSASSNHGGMSNQLTKNLSSNSGPSANSIGVGITTGS
ncbi:hypothetical protein BY996DRAFT_7041386 [Phakopsora pachyrhizi]|uniref:Expressed protein n=1 Tax=Phakopsora pachyrhizi TaxID=170000 RepID=A0AAV0BFQ4_PHAPC|nr:hypothetical protein BY996DRAFT_6420335 [Phakopsora pachyrhizi]KAI8455303.1 hypothetical protein BY996DRAFT_7041386 [Phakopsora pachyrhizi]CAH7685441.1 expressed protein [Phakopsora pachyrhizi]